ncbi:MAG: hypothetical protein ACF8Q5_03140 [Phycisphaerales bacterium JB040]
MKRPRTPLSSIIATTLIAALVWLVAEGQTLRQVQQSLQISFATPEGDSQLIVRPRPFTGWTSEATLQLEGATASIQSLINEISSTVALTTGVELPATPGTHVINLRDAIRRHEAFQGAGVSIISVTPETVEIQVDRLATLSVALQPIVDADLDTAATVQPDTVQLSGPSLVIEQWRTANADADGSEAPVIPVRVDPARLTGLTPGVATDLSGVPVQLPEELRGAWSTRVSPARVTVNVRLRSRTSSVTVRELPVRLLLPPEAFGRWLVEIPPEDRALRDVIFTGPQASIDRIQSGEAVPTPVVELSLQELESGVGSKPARFVDLPRGVTYQVSSSIVRVNLRVLAGVDPNGQTTGQPAGQTPPDNARTQPNPPDANAGGASPEQPRP